MSPASAAVHVVQPGDTLSGIARKQGWGFDIMSTSFFLSRRSVRADANSGMPPWQDRLFILLARNADDASSYFHLPTDRVVVSGSQVSVSLYCRVC